MKTSLKAQVSLFVIIGTIIILGGILLFTFNSDSIRLFADDKSSTKIKTFVDSCLELQSDTAQYKLGVTGGWLYSPQLQYTDREKSEVYNKNAQGLDFLEKNKMPYWFYYDDSVEEFKFNIPEYDSDNQYSLRGQIERYVEETLEDECIKGFSEFEKLYEIEYDKDAIDVEVSFDQDEIQIDMSLPIEILELNTNTSDYVSEFQVDIENKLWVPYNLARDITISEAQSFFIEKRILSFLSPYQSANNRDFLPPFYDFKMTYDFRPWSIPKVEELIKQIVNTHISKIQFLNTDYYERPLPQGYANSEFATALHNLYTKDYITEHTTTKQDDLSLFNKYKEYEVLPTYESFFPTSISIFPAIGDSVLLPRPEAVINFLPFFFTEYTSVYEIAMPIVFEIRSNNENDRFVFNLPIEANIDHNSALGENIQIDSELLKLINERENAALVCDPFQFISEPVYMNITDPINYGYRTPQNSDLNGVEGAIVTFDCKGIASCYVTNTRINSQNEEGNITELKFNLPINCNPGTLKVYKYGHQSIEIEDLDPNLDNPIFLGSYEMASKKTLKLNINILDPEDTKFTEGKDLRDSESGFLIFENLNDKDNVEVVEIKDETFDNLEISLMPGKYKITGFLNYADNINIPSTQICYNKGFFSGSECQEIPEMDLEGWVSGGVEIDEFEITTRNLLNADSITVNMVSYIIPSSYDTLTSSSEEMGNLKELSENKLPYFD